MALWYKVRVVPSCLGYSLLLHCFFLLSSDKGCSFNIFVFSRDFEKRGRVYPALLIVLLFYLAVDAWKIDMLAQSLWYVDIMSDVSLRPESWFEWQTRLVWYSGLQDDERDEWREVARAMIDLLRCCKHGKAFGSLYCEHVGTLCDYYICEAFMLGFMISLGLCIVVYVSTYICIHLSISISLGGVVIVEMITISMCWSSFVCILVYPYMSSYRRVCTIVY